MANYICSNRGHCIFADQRRKFPGVGRGKPICPGCGHSDSVSETSGGLSSLLAGKLGLAVAFIVALTAIKSCLNVHTTSTEPDHGNSAQINQPGDEQRNTAKWLEEHMAKKTDMSPTNPKQNNNVKAANNIETAKQEQINKPPEKHNAQPSSLPEEDRNTAKWLDEHMAKKSETLPNNQEPDNKAMGSGKAETGASGQPMIRPNNAKPNAAETISTKAAANQTPALAPLPSPDRSQPISNPQNFGMIEIGAKGVKGIVVDIAYAKNNPHCWQSDEDFGRCMRESIRWESKRNVNPMDEASIYDTVKEARAMHFEMTELLVDPRQIYLVGSTSIKKVAHKDKLKAELEKVLGKQNDNEMDIVDEYKEGELSFYGVLDLIPQGPKRWREKRRQQALLLDIGSGSTTGGYLESDLSFVPVSTDWGTKKFSEEVDKRKEDKSFLYMAKELQRTLILPKVHEEVDRKQGMKNHGRVYLIGGIAWATSTLTHPENTQRYHRLYPKDFESLLNLAQDSSAYVELCNGPRQHDNTDVKRVCDTFSKENLIAGIEILQTFASELDFAHKPVFFIRDSLYAWPWGYIKSRCQKEHSC